MRVAVITPYYKESRSFIERCLSSVRMQTHAADHFVVSDGHPQDWLDGAGVRHLRLGREHGDYGNTPRTIGALLAVSEGYDAITFLDGDNWYEPDHVQVCVETLERTQADVVTTQRYWARADGTRMPVRMGEDDNGSHVDTNCFFLAFGAFHTLPRWLLMPKMMTMLSDRYYLASLRQEGLKEAGTGRRTVNYLCTWSGLYRQLGEVPPPFTKEVLPLERLQAWIDRLEPTDHAIVKRLCGCDPRVPVHPKLRRAA